MGVLGYGNRGFLSGYPPDVVAVVSRGDGWRTITKSDILRNKRERQQRDIERKRLCFDPIVKPCLIWTFYNDTPFYGGWWLYIRALKREWGVNFRGYVAHDRDRLITNIMRLYPCGLLPIMENFGLWMSAFAEAYHHPTADRPNRQGMATAWAKISYNGRLLDVMRFPKRVFRETRLTNQ